MLDERKNELHAVPAPRVSDARMATIERRLAEIAENGGQRVLALRDAIGKFVDTELATRDDEIERYPEDASRRS